MAFDFSRYLPRYNIVWNSPSRDSMDSMPLSGRLGAGANRPNGKILSEEERDKNLTR